MSSHTCFSSRRIWGISPSSHPIPNLTGHPVLLNHPSEGLLLIEQYPPHQPQAPPLIQTTISHLAPWPLLFSSYPPALPCSPNPPGSFFKHLSDPSTLGLGALPCSPHTSAWHAKANLTLATGTLGLRSSSPLYFRAREGWSPLPQTPLWPCSCSSLYFLSTQALRPSSKISQFLKPLPTMLPSLTCSMAPSPHLHHGNVSGPPLGPHVAWVSHGKAVVTLGCYCLNTVLTSQCAPRLGTHGGQTPCLLDPWSTVPQTGATHKWCGRESDGTDG